jgi:hypothetical protein
MPRLTARPPSQASASAQIKGFVDKFDPAVARMARSCRTALRRRFPTATELVYDNYQALVFGFSSTDRASDAIVSLVIMPRKITMCFIYGAHLSDPKKLLHGGGSQVRFLTLDGPKALDRPGVDSLLRSAIAYGESPLPIGGKGSTIIKSVSIKQRPRRSAPSR